MYYFIVFGKSGFPLRGFGTREEAETFMMYNDDAETFMMYNDDANEIPEAVTSADIAAWIRQKDSCCAFQDLSRQVLEDWEGAKATAQQYRRWFSEYETQRLKEFGLLD